MKERIMIIYRVFSKWMDDPRLLEGAFTDERRATTLAEQLQEENNPGLYRVYISAVEETSCTK
jgi:hypothetical protein